MFIKRVFVVLILLPVGLWAITLGGWPFFLLVGTLIIIAAWEYVQLVRHMGSQPSMTLVVGGTALLLLFRFWMGFSYAAALLSGITLLAMGVHIFAFERGRDSAALDFCVTLAGVVYFGWLGAYLISLRGLQSGQWWVFTALPTIWIADSGAYFIGRKWGRRRLSPRLSPKKTWEGYLGGIVTGVLGTLLLVNWYQTFTAPISLTQAAILGLTLSVVAPLGDLGESMFKRQAGVKDSGKLLPGHGGAFDRIDSWIWVGVLAYYLISLF